MSNQDINERIAALSPEKREILLKNLRQKQGSESIMELPQLIGEGRADLNIPFPLTEIQQAYWLGQSEFFDLGNRGSNIYMEYEIYELNASMRKIAHKRIERAIQRMIQHYDMLKVIISPDGSQQILAEVPQYSIDFIDMRGKKPEIVQARLATVRAQMQTAKIQVNKWPIFEIVAHVLDGGRIRLQFMIPALIMDGTSRGKFCESFIRLFLSPGYQLPPLEVSYRDYVVAWEEFKKGRRYQRAKEAWLKRLPELLPGPALPTTTPVTAKTTSALEVWDVQLVSGADWDELTRLARKHGVSGTNVLLAAYIDTLAYWSNTMQFSIGVIHTYRPPLHPKIEDILGNFNTVGVIAADVRAGDFVQRVKNLQLQVVEAVDNPYFSGLEVIRELNRVYGGRSRVAIPVFFNSLINHVEPISSGSGEEERPIQDSVKGWKKIIRNIRRKQLPKVKEVEVNIFPTQVQLAPSIFEDASGGIYCKWEAANSIFPLGFMREVVKSYQAILKKLAADETSWQMSWGELTEEVFTTVEHKKNRWSKLKQVRVEDDAIDYAQMVQQLEGLWMKILNVTTVSVKDDFFELGGDSVKLVRLVRLMEEEFGPAWAQRLDLGRFYGNPTIECMVGLIFGGVWV